jgi:hypothetical protein
VFRNDSQKDTNTIGQQVKKVHVSLYWQGSLQNFQNQPKKENQQGSFYQLSIAWLLSAFDPKKGQSSIIQTVNQFV